jgi:hypothetical protein
MRYVTGALHHQDIEAARDRIHDSPWLRMIMKIEGGCQVSVVRTDD